jgi:hypothetical protein
MHGERLRVKGAGWKETRNEGRAKANPKAEGRNPNFAQPEPSQKDGVRKIEGGGNLNFLIFED